ncbi:MAG: glycosyltransferase family 39 protein, partial [Epsilonproteobacteria bacterium]|nr:glycosyltransferase family 39 protein [Campylobacterota bacterium]
MNTSKAGKNANNIRGDILALGILLFISLLYLFLTTHKVLLADDHVWPMQVAARIAKGDVLYRDIWWAYPPLPVYLLSFFYRLFGANFIISTIMNQILAILASLLTYRLARFLLSPTFALLSTLVVFMGGLEWRGGGFLAYMFTYTTGISIGGVLGLLFIISFVNYFKNHNLYYLISAGIFTGLCFLTKPEYALATFGTAIVFIVLLTFQPTIFYKNNINQNRKKQLYFPIFVFLFSVFSVVGVSYGYLIYKAGWRNVLAGITGYGQLDIVVHTRPPWGNTRAWMNIFSGLGLN